MVAPCRLSQRFAGASFPGGHHPCFGSPGLVVFGAGCCMAANANAHACPLLRCTAHLLREAAKISPRAEGKGGLLWGLVLTTRLGQRHCTTGLRGFHRGWCREQWLPLTAPSWFRSETADIFVPRWLVLA